MLFVSEVKQIGPDLGRSQEGGRLAEVPREAGDAGNVGVIVLGLSPCRVMSSIIRCRRGVMVRAPELKVRDGKQPS
jgi:hypothetical protein